MSTSADDVVEISRRFQFEFEFELELGFELELELEPAKFAQNYEIPSDRQRWPKQTNRRSKLMAASVRKLRLRL